MKEAYYQVAGQVFVMETIPEEWSDDEWQQYEPFRTEATGEAVFRLRVEKGTADLEGAQEEMHQEDGAQEIVAGHLASGDSYYEFLHGGKRALVLTTNHDYTQAKLCIEKENRWCMNNAVMLIFALATADQQTVLFHSSVIGYQGQGIMFLGKSGTGKSTHARLWTEHIEGSELINDDNPVVRLIDGEPWVFGSPWSGVTPCYRNVKAPIRAFVKLTQAPHNKIARLKGIAAYAAIVPSITGKRWDRRQADSLHDTENRLAQQTRVFHMECLPDGEAARICMEAVISEK